MHNGVDAVERQLEPRLVPHVAEKEPHRLEIITRFA